MTLAQPADSSLPIHISANSANINDNTGITTYIGQVEMKQGSTEIYADKIDLYRKDSEVTRIVATGKQANFRQQPHDNKPLTDAFGDKMDYQVKQQKLTITGNGKILQNSDHFSGEKIIYKMEQGIIDAFGDKKANKGRIQMIIQPKAKSKAQ